MALQRSFEGFLTDLGLESFSAHIFLSRRLSSSTSFK